MKLMLVGRVFRFAVELWGMYDLQILIIIIIITIIIMMMMMMMMMILMIIIIIIIIIIIYIAQFDTNGILTALYIVIKYIQP